MKKIINGILFISLVIFIARCSPEYHKNKFYEKGGKFECNIDTLKVPVIKYVNGEPIVEYKDSIVVTTEVEYKTKWQYRFDNKRFKDSLSVVKRMYSDSLRYAFKSQKSNNKKEAKVSKHENKTKRTEIRRESRSRWFLWLVIGFFIGVVVTIILIRKKYGHKV